MRLVLLLVFLLQTNPLPTNRECLKSTAQFSTCDGQQLNFYWAVPTVEPPHIQHKQKQEYWCNEKSHCEWTGRVLNENFI